MPAKSRKKRRTRPAPTRTSEVLDVKMAAELLTVSPDTVYDLFKGGELLGKTQLFPRRQVYSNLWPLWLHLPR